eukprot:UN20124
MRTCARTFSTICLAAYNTTRDTGMIKFDGWKFPSYERTKNRTSELYLIKIILCATNIFIILCFVSRLFTADSIVSIFGS